MSPVGISTAGVSTAGSVTGTANANSGASASGASCSISSSVISGNAGLAMSGPTGSRVTVASDAHVFFSEGSTVRLPVPRRRPARRLTGAR